MSGTPRRSPARAHDYLRLASGHLNHVSGVSTCQLTVKGDTAKALPFSSVINFPKARQALPKGRLRPRLQET